MPASYAFSIWGLIYALIAIFLGYQALPDTWVVNRNDNLLYTTNGIGYFWSVSVLAGAVWYLGYSLDTVWGYVLALAAISTMLVTAAIMMVKSMGQTVNLIEMVSMRGGFSLYAGWLTAATIL